MGVYFFFYASASCLMSYKSVYQKSLGMSPAQNGILQSVERFLILVFPPLVGALADHGSRHKMLLTTSLFLLSFVLIPGYFIPTTTNDSVNLCRTMNSTLNSPQLIRCNATNDVTLSCEFSSGKRTCVNTAEPFQTLATNNLQYHVASDNCSVAASCDASGESYGNTFVLLMLFTIVYALISAPVGPLLDATTFEILATSGDEHQNYGRQRLFGSVGFGVGALATGYFIDMFTQLTGASHPDYLFVFVLMTVFGIVATAGSFKLNVPRHHMQSILPGLRLIFTSVHIALFVWVIVVHGVVQSIKYTYLFWYAESLQGASTSIFGLAVLSDCLSEVPMFFLSDWFIRKIGHKMLLFLGLVFASIRTLLYAYLTNAWQMVLLEAINGFAFALPMAAMCSYVYKLAPDGMTTTLMSVVQGLYWGLANVFGNLFGGMLYEAYDAKITFKLTAALGFFGAFSFYLFSLVHDRLCKRALTKEGKLPEEMAKLQDIENDQQQRDDSDVKV